MAAARNAVAADRGEILGEHVDEALRLHLLDVGAGGKGLLAAGHDDAADGIIALEIVDGGRNLAEDAEGERIEHLRPVQLDDADRALAFDDDVFERAHAPPTLLIGRAMCLLPRWPSRGLKSCRNKAARDAQPTARPGRGPSGQKIRPKDQAKNSGQEIRP
ncbi:hypothetical protein ACVINU_004011 [Bradyrhizobium diazoefficiens]